MKLEIAAALLLAAAPASALDYTCPTDPGFCYFDVANDGCFDAGTDTGPIDAQLETGTFPAVGPPSPGSIVCPPSVAKLDLFGALAWETAAGGNIELHGTVLSDKAAHGPSRTITASGHLLLRTTMKVEDQLVAVAGGNIEIDGKLQSQDKNTPIEIRSDSGDIVVRPRSKLLGPKGRVEVTATTGNVTFEDRNVVRVAGGFFLEAGGDVSLHDFGSKGTSHVTVGGNFTSTGNLGLIGDVTAGGNVSIERIRNLNSIDGASVTIGLPDENGAVKGSRTRAPRSIVATGPVVIRELTIRSDQYTIETSGTQIDFLDGRVQGSPGGAGVTLRATGPGSVCDVTGTVVAAGSTLTTDCDTVVGP